MAVVSTSSGEKPGARARTARLRRETVSFTYGPALGRPPRRCVSSRTEGVRRSAYLLPASLFFRVKEELWCGYTLTVVQRAVHQVSPPQMSPTWALGTGALPTLVPLLTAGELSTAFCGMAFEKHVELFCFAPNSEF